MSVRARSRAVRGVAVALLLASVGAVSGCSAQPAMPVSVALSEQQGWPEAEAPGPPPLIDTYPTPPVGWVAPEGDRFWLVTWGSSSCVFDATEVEALDDSTVAVRFEQAPAEGCTGDLAPRAHELAVPESLVGSLETAEVVLVESAFAHLGGEIERSEWTVDLVDGWFGTVAETIEPGLAPGLPPGDPESFEPRVLLRESLIALVTFGSSSCPALPTAAGVEGDVLALTVEPRPAEVCTADMAPTTSFFPAPVGFDPDTVLMASVTLVDPPAPDATTTVTVERLDETG